MTRRVATVLGLGLLAGSVGCKYFPSRTRTETVPSVTSSGTAKLPLLIGPQGNESNVTELPPKEAIVAWLGTAHEMEKNGQPEAAIELYEKARAADPKLGPDISRRLAVLYDQAEEFTKAQVEYEAALKANPTDPELLADLGYSYYCRGDWKRAEEVLRHVVGTHSGHKRAWMNLGLTLCATGRFEDGHDAFRRTGTEAEARVNLAFALAVQGRYDDAKQQYKAALQLEPGMKLARGALAALDNPRPAKKKPTKLNDDIPVEHQIRSVHEIEKELREADDKRNNLPPVELGLPRQ